MNLWSLNSTDSLSTRYMPQDTERYRNSRISVVTKKAHRGPFHPHKPFENWRKKHQIPWICLVEIAMMIFYFILTALHQDTVIGFALDFGKVINDFFLSGYDFDPQEEYTNSWAGEFSFKSSLIRITNDTSYRLFEFPQSLPCGYSFFAESSYTAKVKTKKGHFLDVKITEQNASSMCEVVKHFFPHFSHLSMKMLYHMQIVSQHKTNRYELGVIVNFDLDQITKQIRMGVDYTKNPKNTIDVTEDLLNNYQFMFPMCLTILAGVGIILTIRYAVAVYNYSKHKAEKNFLNVWSIVKSKFDKWAIYALISHFVSLISCSIYIVYGQNVQSELPLSMILMGVATFMHSILLIRYLEFRSSTMIIVNVIFYGGVAIFEFLIACCFILAGYMIFGMCFFGTSSEQFSNIIGAATCLVSMVHGDSIQDMFDAVTIRSSEPTWCGVLYMMVWAFFSLTIMFNISIAIFEEALLKQIYEASVEKKNNDDDEIEQAAADQIPLTMPSFRKFV